MQCPRCFQRFSNANNEQTPRILVQCGHTYCLLCLFTLQKPLNSEKIEIKCPECQTLTYVNGGIETLPKNLAILTIEDQGKQSKQSSRSSTNRSSTDKQEYCMLHSKKLEAFCVDDHELVCIDCIVIGSSLMSNSHQSLLDSSNESASQNMSMLHQGHNLVSVDAGIEQVISSIKNNQDVIKDSLGSQISHDKSRVDSIHQQVTQQYNVTLESIGKFYSQIKQQIDEREKSLIQEQEKKWQKSLEEIEYFKAKISQCQQLQAEYLGLSDKIILQGHVDKIKFLRQTLQLKSIYDTMKCYFDTSSFPQSQNFLRKDPSTFLFNFWPDKESQELSRIFNDKFRSPSPLSKHYKSTQNFFMTKQNPSKMFSSFSNRHSITRKSFIQKDMSSNISGNQISKKSVNNPEEECLVFFGTESIDQRFNSILKNSSTATAAQKLSQSTVSSNNLNQTYSQNVIKEKSSPHFKEVILKSTPVDLNDNNKTFSGNSSMLATNQPSQQINKKGKIGQYGGLVGAFSKYLNQSKDENSVKASKQLMKSFQQNNLKSSVIQKPLNGKLNQVVRESSNPRSISKNLTKNQQKSYQTSTQNLNDTVSILLSERKSDKNISIVALQNPQSYQSQQRQSLTRTQQILRQHSNNQQSSQQREKCSQLRKSKDIAMRSSRVMSKATQSKENLVNKYLSSRPPTSNCQQYQTISITTSKPKLSGLQQDTSSHKISTNMSICNASTSSHFPQMTTQQIDNHSPKSEKSPNFNHIKIKDFGQIKQGSQQNLVPHEAAIQYITISNQGSNKCNEKGQKNQCVNYQMSIKRNPFEPIESKCLNKGIPTKLGKSLIKKNQDTFQRYQQQLQTKNLKQQALNMLNKNDSSRQNRNKLRPQQIGFKKLMESSSENLLLQAPHQETTQYEEINYDDLSNPTQMLNQSQRGSIDGMVCQDLQEVSIYRINKDSNHLLNIRSFQESVIPKKLIMWQNQGYHMKRQDEDDYPEKTQKQDHQIQSVKDFEELDPNDDSSIMSQTEKSQLYYQMENSQIQDYVADEKILSTSINDYYYKQSSQSQSPLNQSQTYM